MSVVRILVFGFLIVFSQSVLAQGEDPFMAELQLVDDSSTNSETQCLVDDTDENKCLKCACFMEYKFLTNWNDRWEPKVIDQDVINQIVRTVRTRGEFGNSDRIGRNSCEAYRARRQFASYTWATRSQPRTNGGDIEPGITYATMDIPAITDACEQAIETVSNESLTRDTNNTYYYTHAIRNTHRLPSFISECAEERVIGSYPLQISVFDCPGDILGMERNTDRAGQSRTVVSPEDET